MLKFNIKQTKLKKIEGVTQFYILKAKIRVQKENLLLDFSFFLQLS